MSAYKTNFTFTLLRQSAGSFSPELEERRVTKRMTKEKQVTVLGAGYSGLTTAAELTLRGFKV